VKPGNRCGLHFTFLSVLRFFADHFPRRPVLPGSLLMKADLQLVSALAAGFPVPQHGGHWVPKGISNMKLRTFTPPGEVLEMEASLEQLSLRRRA